MSNAPSADNDALLMSPAAYAAARAAIVRPGARRATPPPAEALPSPVADAGNSSPTTQTPTPAPAGRSRGALDMDSKEYAAALRQMIPTYRRHI